MSGERMRGGDAPETGEAAEKAKMRRVLAIFGPAVFAGALCHARHGPNGG
jgi:hypothetical protein